MTNFSPIKITRFPLLVLVFLSLCSCAQFSNLQSLKKEPRVYEQVSGFPSDIGFWFDRSIEASDIRRANLLFVAKPVVFGMQDEELLTTEQTQWLVNTMERSLTEHFSAFYDVTSQAIGAQLSVRSELMVYQNFSAANMRRLSSGYSSLVFNKAQEELMVFDSIVPVIARYEIEFVGAAGKPLFAVESTRSLNPEDYGMPSKEKLVTEESSGDEGLSAAKKLELGSLIDFFDLMMDAAIRRLAERSQ